jgi:putative ABC transport system permease protein
MKLLRRILYLWNRGVLERDLQDEMSAHREMLTGDRKRYFGSDLRLRELSREAWGFVWLDQIRQDLAYAARALRRSPGFTLAAIGILALGVGLNLAAFHLYNAAVWNRISVRDASSLYQVVRQQTKERGPARFPVAAVNFYREYSTSFAYMVAENTGIELFLDTDPQPVRSNFVSGNYFKDLDVRPWYGRLLDQRDAAQGAPLVAVLGYEYWQLHLGSDPGVINHPLRINGQTVQVVGVAPPSFDGLLPRETAVWLPATAYPTLAPGGPSLNDFSRPDTNMFVKLKPGVSMPSAEAELRALTSELAREQPNFVQSGETIRGQLLSKSRFKLGPLPLIVPLVLLILFAACANLGTVLLARGLVRQQEIRTRSALGASRIRIVRQLVTENLLLAALGSAASLVVGAAGAKLLLFLTDAPPDIKVVTDWRVLLAGVVLTVLSVVGFGLAPVIQALRGALLISRARQVLLGVQVAVSCILLILSTVLAKSGWRLVKLNLRFDAAQIAVIEAYGANILEPIAVRIRQAPGVDGVAFARNAPLHEFNIGHNSGLPETIWNDVEPGYFQVMNLPVLRGRIFLPGEQNAVVLSESAARAVWPNDDPLGKTWPSDLGPRNVVGVVMDSGAGGMVLGTGTDSEAVEAYLPLTNKNVPGIKLLVHTTNDPAATLRYIRSAYSGSGTYVDAWLVQSDLNKRISESRMVIQLVGATSALATLIAAIGIFGLFAFAVARRTREIGVRVALGADSLQIVQILLQQYTIALGIGGLAGVMLAAAGEQILRNQLSGLPALDPLSYITGLAGFAIVAAAAVLVPARRALQIDPASALRWE